MVETFEVFVALDVSKDSHAVAEGGRDGEVRSLGAISSDPAAVRRLVRKLERPGARLRFCYEAGPTGHGLKHQIEELGHECAVIAPSLIPRRACERVKTNRRDAVKLARNRQCRANHPFRGRPQQDIGLRYYYEETTAHVVSASWRAKN